MQGGSLASLVAKFGPLDEAVIRTYTRQLLSGVRMYVGIVLLLASSRHEDNANSTWCLRLPKQRVQLEAVYRAQNLSLCGFQLQRVLCTERLTPLGSLHGPAGLAYLHALRTIHRDIKCANLLLDKDGIIKLADLGMAKQLVEAVSVTQSFKGSAFWMVRQEFAADTYSVVACRQLCWHQQQTSSSSICQGERCWVLALAHAKSRVAVATLHSSTLRIADCCVLLLPLSMIGSDRRLKW
jgi:serine/threonine protein kinase